MYIIFIKNLYKILYGLWEQIFFKLLTERKIFFQNIT